MGRKQIRHHGDENRFQVLAEFIYETFGKKIKYIADVAGGQGSLTRILNKKYNYVSEVIDPRHYTVKGISHRESEYNSDMASFYDLIVGLHPDEATKEVVKSAFIKPTIIIPCCNHWDEERKLGSKAIAEDIKLYLDKKNIKCYLQELKFNYPNIAVIALPYDI